GASSAGADAVRWLAVVALTGLLLAPHRSGAVQPAKTHVQISSRIVRLVAGPVVAEVRRTPLRLRLLSGGRTLVREQGGGGLFYERAGTVHGLGAVREARRVADGVELEVETDEGGVATVTVRFLTRRTLEVTLVPPEPAGVNAVGERLRSPASEHIYGLTERLRDSPVIRPGVLDFS